MIKHPLIGLVISILAAHTAWAAGLSPDLYRQLEAVQERMDAGKHRENLPQLQRLLRDAKGDAYAEAVIRQHLGYNHLALEQTSEAKRELSRALTLDTLPAQTNRQLRLLLAQIANRLNQAREALTHLQAWLDGAKSLSPEQQVMAAQIYHRAGKPTQAMRYLEQAIARKADAPEVWQRSLLGMYLQAQRHGPARRLLRGLLRQHPKKTEYWHHLAGLELRDGHPEQALNVMALAHEQGLLAASELTRFARLHAANGIPEKAARLLRDWRESGRLGITLKRLRSEADLWLMARERDQALAVLSQSADLAKNGADDYRRGQILFDAGRWRESQAALQRALQRGGLKQPHNARLLLGMAAYQAGDRPTAREALLSAGKHASTRTRAQTWLANLDALASE